MSEPNPPPIRNAGRGVDEHDLMRSSVDYLLRTTQQNLVQLSSMADQKANILLGASLIMLTIIVGISSNSGITASLASLGVFTAISAVLSLLAVLPSAPKSSGREPNPLFFGDISRMSQDQHRRLLATRIQEDNSLFELISTDIYQSACVLQRRKFTYLRVSYAVFIVGLMTTSVVMVIEWSTGRI